MPTWGVLRRAVTVHNLGGATVGTTDDPRGRASAVVSFLALLARGAVRGLLGWRRR